MAIDEETITVTTNIAGAGVATGNETTTRNMNGFIEAIYIDYDASAPSTTDVTVEEVNAYNQTILSIVDNATDGWYYPRSLVEKADGTDATDYFTKFAISGPIKVTVAQANNSQTFKVRVKYSK